VNRSGTRKGFSMKTKFIEKLNLLRHCRKPCERIQISTKEKVGIEKLNTVANSNSAQTRIPSEETVT